MRPALPHFLAEVDCPFNAKELCYLDQYVEHIALSLSWAQHWIKMAAASTE